MLAGALTACTVSTPTTAPAPSPDVDTTQLTSSAWQLVQYQNKAGESAPVLEGTEITAIFGEEGSLVGSAGCNSYTANYETEGGAIAIGAVAATQKACAVPEGVMEQESGYITALSLVLGWNVEGDNLVLSDGNGTPLLAYQAAAETAEASLGQPSDIATAFLGDRVQINSLSVNDGGVIAVDMITHGPDDPMCCPTLHVLQTYVVQRGELVEGARTELGTVQ